MPNTGSGNTSSPELHKTKAPQVVGPDPADVEAVARVISNEIGYPYDTLYEDKRDWIDGRGERYDVNVPYKSDMRYAAEAAIAALIERGWRPPGQLARAQGDDDAAPHESSG